MNAGRILGALALALVSCADPSSLGEPSAQESSALSERDDPPTNRRADVLTQNVYLGADIAVILASPSPEEVPVRVAEAWAQAQSNDFRARARALAATIADARPALVGLQEVAEFRVQSPGDAIVGGATPATHVAQDYLAALLDALAARGARYVPVAVQTDSDVEVPMFAGVDPATGAPRFDDLRFLDRDVILARADVETWSPRSARYTQGLPVSVGGASLEIVRGWASVAARLGPRTIRFVTTHLEEETVPEVQAAQATELLGVLGRESLPVVLVGDFNSAGDDRETPTHSRFVRAGFLDAWSAANPREAGPTCCQDADLRNVRTALDRRIDFVFLRPARGTRFHGIHADLVNERPIARPGQPGPRWASDHAGVAVSFSLSR